MFQVGIFDRVPCKGVCFLLHLRFEIVSVPANGCARFCRNSFCVSCFEYKDISCYRSAVISPLIEGAVLIGDRTIILNVIRITRSFQFYRYAVGRQVRVSLYLAEHQIRDLSILRKIRSEDAGFFIKLCFNSVHLRLICRIDSLRGFQGDRFRNVFVITARSIRPCRFFISVGGDRIGVFCGFIQFIGAVFFRVYCDFICDPVPVVIVIGIFICYFDCSIRNILIIAVDRLECNVIFGDVLRHSNVDGLISRRSKILIVNGLIIRRLYAVIIGNAVLQTVTSIRLRLYNVVISLLDFYLGIRDALACRILHIELDGAV